MISAGTIRFVKFIILMLSALFVFNGVFAAEDNTLQAVIENDAAADLQPDDADSGLPEHDVRTITVDNSGGEQDIQTITSDSSGIEQDIQTVTSDDSSLESDVQIITADNSWIESAVQTITVEYSGAEKNNQTITVDFSDGWLMQPDDVYNHKLMQASFALAAASFRDKTRDIAQRDFNILDFFAQAGFTDPQTYDFHVIPSIDTIGTAIAYKNVGDATLIAVSISGNNYQGEWAGNLTVDDENRVKGFNDAADKVMGRLKDYIHERRLRGNLRLWTAGYSRSAAVTNDFAADAVDSGLFEAVYAYTFATPRTTREENADQYHTIFNLLNPFDMVPLSPFPEWGFHRYGIDLFFPAIESDSRWFMLQEDVFLNYFELYGEKIVLNPQINKNLHTVFDYLAFFINSADSYKTNVQNPLVEFIQTRDLRTLIHDISKLISFNTIREYMLRRDTIARYQMHELYNFLDFITQFVYLGLIGQHDVDAENIYWDPALSVQENLAFNHYDKTYRAWLFSTDNPEDLLSREANYAHVVIQGDVDVDVFDENFDFIVSISNKFDSYSYELDDVHMPDYKGVDSDTFVYFELQKGQTLIILPLDQVFHVGIYSNQDQTIRVSYVEFSADRLRGNVRYVYLDNYDAGEYYVETFDPEKEREYTTEDLLNMGVLVEEPWSNNIVYSPTAIMRLENEGIPHPSPRILIGLILFVLLLFLIIFILIIILICKILKRILKKRPSASRS